MSLAEETSQFLTQHVFAVEALNGSLEEQDFGPIPNIVVEEELKPQLKLIYHESEDVWTTDATSLELTSNAETLSQFTTQETSQESRVSDAENLRFVVTEPEDDEFSKLRFRRSAKESEELTIVGYFNPHILHSLPIAITAISNGLLRYRENFISSPFIHTKLRVFLQNVHE